MNIVILDKDSYAYKKWDGGITNQLLILPPQANYGKLNFDLRISKAKITSLHSSFSILPGVNRNLLFLEGASLLTITPNKHQLLLPGDEINFKGDLPIQCKGKGIDFNVMLTKGGKVSSQLLQMEKGECLELDQTTSGQFLFLHANKGNIKVGIGNEKFILKQEMSLYINELNEEVLISIEANKTAEVILTEVLLK
jgi:environmental stress-induced protein Ves